MSLSGAATRSRLIIVANSVTSNVRKCAVPPSHLCSVTTFSRCKIPNLISYIQWCRRRGCSGWKRIPKRFDLVKIRAKSVEIWAKCVKTFAKSLDVHCFLNNGAQNQRADVFLEVIFLFFSGKLRKIWAKTVLDVLWFEKNTPRMK